MQPSLTAYTQRLFNVANLNMDSSPPIPRLRWGVLGTGWVSDKFVKDLLIPRDDAAARHVFQALGTSNEEKGRNFVQECYAEAPSTHPRAAIYTSYSEVYADELVDIVYVGIPHSLHKEACLAAIEAGKHVLCEKPITVNAKEAKEVIAAARKKGVFLMEAVWTRFFPLVRDAQRMLHDEKVIGDVQRMFCDFGINMNMAAIPSHSRLKDPALGAGALLDLGIYPVAFGNLFLDGRVGDEAERPAVSACMKLVDGIDHANVVILNYEAKKRVAILSSTLQFKTADTFCRIEGSKGELRISGPAGSVPKDITIIQNGKAPRTIKYTHPGKGFYFEADQVALDIGAGRTENSIMPLAESLRMMELLDGIRHHCGLRYPQD